VRNKPLTAKHGKTLSPLNHACGSEPQVKHGGFCHDYHKSRKIHKANAKTTSKTILLLEAVKMLENRNAMKIL
jgi:hypothetical protein